jgi:hypothetical protein
MENMVHSFFGLSVTGGDLAEKENPRRRLR